MLNSWLTRLYIKGSFLQNGYRP